MGIVNAVAAWLRVAGGLTLCYISRGLIGDKSVRPFLKIALGSVGVLKANGADFLFGATMVWLALQWYMPKRVAAEGRFVDFIR